MSTRVIQKIIQFIHLVLHRGFGSFTSNPYIFKINNIVPRCSGTFIKNKAIRTVGIFASFALTLLTVAAVFPITHKTDTAEATYVPATTTLSIVSSKDTASVDITPTSASGTFATSAAADMAEFTVTTDNLTGYSLNILGTDTSGQLVNSTTGDTLDTIAADTTENDFRTGLASTYNNKWGYRLTVNSATTTNFFSAPTSTTTAKTIYTTTSPNTTADSYTLGVGARVDFSKPVGTYTNTFVLTAVANNISYQINYLDSDGTTPLLTPDAESDISASSIELNTTTPTKSGYAFLGWCDGTLSSDGTSCTGTPGTTYQPGDTYTFTSFTSGTTTANLYAMWEGSGNYIQDFTPAQCSTLASSADYTLIDKRDGNDYTVRWINGNCWMTQNLRYVGNGTIDGSGNISGTMALNSTTSNVSSVYTPTNPLTIIYTDILNTHSNTDATIHDSGNTTSGVYYNYPAISAMSVVGDVAVEATQSLCPAGWRLPTHDEQSTITSYKNLFNPLIGGYYYNYAYYNDSLGLWWSSTSYTASEPWDLRYNGSSLFGGNRTGRYTAIWARCIADTQTMQDFSNTDASLLATNQQITLRDERDDQLYTVKKLDDGNVWMTRNLAIGCNGTGSTYGSGYSAKTLTPTDSNVNNSSYTTSTTSLTNGNSYDDAYQTCSNTYGAWYNYVAASAGTITGSSNTTNATYDICPKGWRLPTGVEQSGVTSYASALSPTTGGLYGNGSLLYTSYGDLWSSTSYNATRRHQLSWSGSSLTASDDNRIYGFYVRCVKDSGLEMQNITYADLNQYIPNAGDSITLTDNRDGQKYKVAKLADGNIWMTENLSLDISDSAVQANLNSNTTNADNTTLGYLKSGGGSGQYPASGVVSSSWANDYANPYIATGYKNTIQAASGSAPAGRAGVYYNFCAASAGSYCYASGSGTGDASQDICPSGWRMPTGGPSSEYLALYTAYGSNAANFMFALNTPLSGYFYSGSAVGQGTNALFLSSTRYITDYMYFLYAPSASTINPQYNNNYYDRGFGFSVRCILNDSNTLSSITNMQQVTGQVVAKASNGDTATLTDTRDGQEYTVAKINGNLWMTRNLAIGCDGSGSTYGSNMSSKTLLPSDSNVSSAWATPTNSLTLGNHNTDPRMECSSTYGGYYNYAAASAGTITGSSNTDPQTYDICPSGWHLPTNAEQSAIVSYGTAYNIAYGGNYYSGVLSYQGSYGYWWSSTAQDSSARYEMYGTSSSLHISTSVGSNYRYYGFSVRCIAN